MKVHLFSVFVLFQGRFRMDHGHGEVTWKWVLDMESEVFWGLSVSWLLGCLVRARERRPSHRPLISE